MTLPETGTQRAAGITDATPAYWSQLDSFDNWTAPHDPNDLVRAVFSVPSTLLTPGGTLDLNNDGSGNSPTATSRA